MGKEVELFFSENFAGAGEDTTSGKGKPDEWFFSQTTKPHLHSKAFTKDGRYHEILIDLTTGGRK